MKKNSVKQQATIDRHETQGMLDGLSEMLFFSVEFSLLGGGESVGSFSKMRVSFDVDG